MKIVLVGDDGGAVAEIEDIEQYDLSTTRGRAMLVDDILVALGQADRRRVLNFMRDHHDDDPSSLSAVGIDGSEGAGGAGMGRSGF